MARRVKIGCMEEKSGPESQPFRSFKKFFGGDGNLGEGGAAQSYGRNLVLPVQIT